MTFLSIGLNRRMCQMAFSFCAVTVGLAGIRHDPANHTVTMADARQNLQLGLNYDHRCVIDRLMVRGREVVLGEPGVYSGWQYKNGANWFTTQRLIDSPAIQLTSNAVTLTGIRLGGTEPEVEEEWQFKVMEDQVIWRIDRRYLKDVMIEDTCMPGWEFPEMSTWDGALLGNGGVAWTKFFDRPQTTYGVHTGDATFWHRQSDTCLRITPKTSANESIAQRFSRQGTAFLMATSVTREERVPKYPHFRFRADKTDVWAPFQVAAGQTVRVEYSLSAPRYGQHCDRGIFPGLNGGSIREILNTIARVGVVDAKLIGSNNWRLGYAVLHEQWLALLGLAIDDPDYIRAFSQALDYQRDFAISPEGRVKSRWCYNAGDAAPGTYDAHGFYECQWGLLMDSQPSYVINVAEQFDLTGDLNWVRSHKAACEMALNYLLRRDANRNYLVEVATQSHAEHKASDWLDVIWASYESAYINAQLYYALIIWSDIEDTLQDVSSAHRYREFARHLKRSFNRTTEDGGFWDTRNQWYVYWRDADGSIHGNNLTLPVNFMAIAYGLCEPARRAAILTQVEKKMQEENLFFWPLNIYTFSKDDTAAYHFPDYENGNIFLGWGELGMRAYAHDDPAIAIKYLQRVLQQYEFDGLAYQHYHRYTKAGAGDDILANNANPVVGLYRDIYGIQPKPNRLYLEPHLTPALNGTRLKYWLRDQQYLIDLNTTKYQVSVDEFVISTARPFAVNVKNRTVEYFDGASKSSSLAVTKTSSELCAIQIQAWPDTLPGICQWSESCQNADERAQHIISGLKPQTPYHLYHNGRHVQILSTDEQGGLCFEWSFRDGLAHIFEIRPGG